MSIKAGDRMPSGTFKTTTADGRRDVTTEELFKGKSPKQWRAAYAVAFEWGPDVGREIVE